MIGNEGNRSYNHIRMAYPMENQTLHLIPLTEGMIDALLCSDEAFYQRFHLINQGDEFLTPSKEYLLKEKLRMKQHPEEFPFTADYLIVLKDTSTVIGSIDFKCPVKDGITDIGYGMNKAYEGHGYMTMAVRLMLAYAREHGVKEVHADTFIDNFKSQNVLSRVGFTQVGQDAKLRYFSLKLS